MRPCFCAADIDLVKMFFWFFLALVVAGPAALGSTVRVSTGAELLVALDSKDQTTDVIELPARVTVTAQDWPHEKVVSLSRNVQIRPAPEVLALGMKVREIGPDALGLTHRARACLTQPPPLSHWRPLLPFRSQAVLDLTMLPNRLRILPGVEVGISRWTREAGTWACRWDAGVPGPLGARDLAAAAHCSTRQCTVAPATM